MALHSLYCADVPLRNCSLSHLHTYLQWCYLRWLPLSAATIFSLWPHQLITTQNTMNHVIPYKSGVPILSRQVFWTMSIIAIPHSLPNANLPQATKNRRIYTH